jgi:MFS family permease
MLGKKRTIIVSMALNAAGWVTMGFADSLAVLIIGFLLTQTAWAFYSGSSEALVYDSMKERGTHADFDKVLAFSQSVSFISLVVSTLLGGVMYNLWFRLPHVAWGVVYGVGFVAAFALREPHVEGAPHFSMRGYVRQLGRGFAQLSVPSVRWFVPIVFATIGAYQIFSFGLISPAIAANFGFDANGQAVVFGGAILASALMVGFVPFLRRRLGELGATLTVGTVLLTGYALAALPLGVWGVIAIVLIRVGGSMSYTATSSVMNAAIPSTDRATTLSTVALLTKIPYALTAILAGVLAQNGQLWVFNVAVALGIGLLMLLGLWMRRRTLRTQ